MIYHHRKNARGTGETQAQSTYLMSLLLGLRVREQSLVLLCLLISWIHSPVFRWLLSDPGEKTILAPFCVWLEQEVQPCHFQNQARRRNKC